MARNMNYISQEKMQSQNNPAGLLAGSMQVKVGSMNRFWAEVRGEIYYFQNVFFTDIRKDLTFHVVKAVGLGFSGLGYGNAILADHIFLHWKISGLKVERQTNTPTEGGPLKPPRSRRQYINNQQNADDD